MQFPLGFQVLVDLLLQIQNVPSKTVSLYPKRIGDDTQRIGDRRLEIVSWNDE